MATESSGRLRQFRLTTTDRAILAILEEDARRSTTDIAAALGCSRTTVKNRIAAMRKSGVIRRFTIEMDSPRRTNSRSKAAFFFVQLRRPICRAVYQSIRGWPELVQTWSVTGETDCLVQVRARDNDGIERLRQGLVDHPEVKHVTTMLALEEWVRRVSNEHQHYLSERKIGEVDT